MNKAFTLIELIVVIIIVGILAALGISQYSKTVEKGRKAEAKTNAGTIRNLAYEYWLEKGTMTGMADADVNIGTGATQIPISCRSTHYFRYFLSGLTAGSNLSIYCVRCTADGKSPQGNGYTVELVSDFSTGVTIWGGWGD